VTQHIVTKRHKAWFGKVRRKGLVVCNEAGHKTDVVGGVVAFVLVNGFEYAVSNGVYLGGGDDVFDDTPSI
jgi:hypothetical protein